MSLMHSPLVVAFGTAFALSATSAAALPCEEMPVDLQLEVWTSRGVAPACVTPDDTYDIENILRDGDADRAIDFAIERGCTVLLDRDMMQASRVHHYDFVAITPITIQGDYAPDGIGEYYVSTSHLIYPGGDRAAGLWRETCDALKAD